MDDKFACLEGLPHAFATRKTGSPVAETDDSLTLSVEQKLLQRNGLTSTSTERRHSGHIETTTRHADTAKDSNEGTAHGKGVIIKGSSRFYGDGEFFSEKGGEILNFFGSHTADFGGGFRSGGGDSGTKNLNTLGEFFEEFFIFLTGAQDNIDDGSHDDGFSAGQHEQCLIAAHGSHARTGTDIQHLTAAVSCILQRTEGNGGFSHVGPNHKDDSTGRPIALGSHTELAGRKAEHFGDSAVDAERRRHERGRSNSLGLNRG